MADHPVARRLAPAFRNAPCAFDGSRRLPNGLNRHQLIARHGFILGTLLLWLNRTQVRHQLARLAADAQDAILSDMGISRARLEQEAARRFWEELEFR